MVAQISYFTKKKRKEKKKEQQKLFTNERKTIRTEICKEYVYKYGIIDGSIEKIY